MNDLEPKFSRSTEANGDSGCVQGQLNLLRAGLILLSALFAVCIWVQVHYLHIERANLQPIIQSYDRDKLTVDPLLAKIGEYGRTHPAFAPIMQKYQIQVPTNAPGVPTAAKPGAPAAAKPAPTPSAVPKK